MTVSRRKAVFIMMGESELNGWDCRRRRRPWWRRRRGRCGRFRCRVRAAIWPGPVSSPGVAAAKVKALPARTPRTREMMPASPMQMPMMLVWSFMRSRKRMRVTLSKRDLAVGTILTKSGLKGSMRA